MKKINSFHINITSILFIALAFFILSEKTIAQSKGLQLTEEERSFIQLSQVNYVAVLKDSTPFSYVENGKSQGYSVELLKLIAQKTGLRFKFIHDSWPNSLEKFRNKQVDVILDISYRKAREAYTLYTDPYFVIPVVVFLRDDFGAYRGLDDLKGKEVGIVRNVFFENELRKVKGIKVSEWDLNRDMTQALSYGKIDGIIQRLSSIHTVIKKYNYTNIKVAGKLNLPTIKNEDLRIGVVPEMPVLFSIIEKGLNAITAFEKNRLENTWLGAELDVLVDENDSQLDLRDTLSDEEIHFINDNPMIRMCVVSDLMPFEGVDENGSLTGLSADLVVKTGSELGAAFQVNEKTYPVQSLQNGECDIIPSYLVGSKPVFKLRTTTPYLIQPFVIATRTEALFVSDESELAGKNLGVVRGSESRDLLLKRYPGLQLIDVDHIRSGLEQVRDGKLFGFIDSLSSIGFHIHKHSFFNLKIAGKLDTNIQVSVAYRESAPLLGSIMQKTVDYIPEKEKRESVNKWMAIRFEQGIDYSLIWKILAGVMLGFLFILFWNHKLQAEVRKRKSVEDELLTRQELIDSVSEIAGISFWQLSFIPNWHLILTEQQMTLMGTTSEAEGSTNILWDVFLTEFVDEGSKSIWERELNKIFQYRKINHGQFEYKLIRRDGSFRYVMVDYQVIYDNKDKLTSVRGSSIDITEQKNRQKEIEEARKIAENAARSKSEFLANMSHEIITPLNAVTGFSELLTSLMKDEKQKSYLSSIKTAGKNLLTLINDILELSRIEAHRLELQYDLMDIRTLINEIQQILTIQISRKNIEMIIEFDDQLPSYLFLDEIRLRQILINVVGNAVKFTENGYIKINVKVDQPKEENRINIVLSVEDTGIGINEEDLEDIFDSFKQQTGQDTAKYGGTGLGLAISKKLIEMMNGTIGVESERGRGTVFTMHLNQVEYSSKESPAQESLIKWDSVRFEEARILVVDDVASNQRLLIELLGRLGLDVITADNGQEALVITHEYKPEVILMDIRMPVMDGYEATKVLKNDVETKDIPIIAVTASASSVTTESLIEKGFDGYISKPIKVIDLIDELKIYLKPKENPISLQKEIDSELESGEELNLKTKADLPQVLEWINNEIYPQWKKLINRQPIDEVNQFGKNIVELGDKYDVVILSNYGKRLLIFLDNFDITKIRETLRDFPDLIKQLENHK